MSDQAKVKEYHRKLYVLLMWESDPEKRIQRLANAVRDEVERQQEKVRKLRDRWQVELPHEFISELDSLLGESAKVSGAKTEAS